MSPGEGWHGRNGHVAVEVKAAHGDRTFIVFGPQVIVEESGRRIPTPGAMDVFGL